MVKPSSAHVRTKPTRSYLFTITTTYNDIPYRTFHSLSEARSFSADFKMTEELYWELNDMMGDGICDVVGTKIFFFRDSRVVRCWSEDLDWANESCVNCPAKSH